MRSRVFLLGLALCSCAKGTSSSVQATRANGNGSRAALLVLASVGAHEEREVLAAAATVAREGAAAPADATLRCVRGDPREKVRDACLVAWSVNGDASPEIEEILRGLIPTASRAAALAAVRRSGFARRLEAGDLVTLLRRLPDPSWARAMALREWTSANPVPPYLAGPLWAALALPAVPDPLTLGASAAAASRIGGEALESVRSSYCPAAASGPLLTRCYRFASTLVDPRTGSFTAFPSLPSRRDPAWALFVTSFPERSRLLEPHL